MTRLSGKPGNGGRWLLILLVVLLLLALLYFLYLKPRGLLDLGFI